MFRPFPAPGKADFIRSGGIGRMNPPRALYWLWNSMRICSLLPAATEILFAIGAGDQVAGVTAECDYPPVAAARPAVVHPRIEASASAGEIDRRVRAHANNGESTYAVDADLLRVLEPDLIVTQDTCRVCAASPADLDSAFARLRKPPQVISLSASTLAGLWKDIRAVGEAVGRPAAAEELISRLESRLRRVQSAMEGAARPRVVCLEWLDPLFYAGHWVPEMVELAGGTSTLGEAGKPSARTDWNAIVSARPEAIVLMPCGYDLDHTLEEYLRMSCPPEWWALEAVRAGRVSAVNGKNFFSRPGPRLVDGVEILGHILHPERASWLIPPGSVAPAERAP